MSWLGTIIKDVESVASKVEHDLETIWKKAPSFTSILSTSLTIAAPLIEEGITLTAGAPLGASVTVVLNKVEQDIVAAKNLVNIVGPTPSVQSLLTGVINDLTPLESAAQITNSQTKANIATVLNILQALVNAFTPAVTVNTGQMNAAPSGLTPTSALTGQIGTIGSLETMGK